MYVVLLNLCDTIDQFGMFLHIEDDMYPRMVNVSSSGPGSSEQHMFHQETLYNCIYCV